MSENMSDESPKNEVRYTIRFAAEFHDRLLLAMAQRRVRHIQKAVMQALEQWIAGERQAVSKPVAEPELSERLDTLIRGQSELRDIMIEFLEKLGLEKKELEKKERVRYRTKNVNERYSDKPHVSVPEHILERMDQVLTDAKELERDITAAEQAVETTRRARQKDQRTTKRGRRGKTGTH